MDGMTRVIFRNLWKRFMDAITDSTDEKGGSANEEKVIVISDPWFGVVNIIKIERRIENEYD